MKNPKHYVVRARIGEREQAALERLSALTGNSTSEILRQLILGATTVVVRSPVVEVTHGAVLDCEPERTAAAN